jgi:hypothetical protein
MILDSGVFILAERNPAKCAAFINRFKQEPFFSNENVLAQVWRKPSNQVLLTRFITDNQITILPVSDGKAMGILLEQSRTSDVVDATVALLAVSMNDVVLTSDPDDLKRLGAAVVAL